MGKAKIAGLGVNRIGPKFTAQDVERIQPEKTGLEELESWFGPPVIVGPNEKGATTATWYSTVHGYGGFVDTFEHQNLTVTLNDADRVTESRFRGRLKLAKN